MESRDIGGFWNWFSTIARELSLDLENEEILRQIDKRIVGLGGFAWEVGPGLRKPNALVISPGGDRALLPVTREIVSMAPEIAEWEFHAAKPPKAWNLRFYVDGENGRRIEVDASDWEYVLLKAPDESFDLLLRAPNLERLPLAVRQPAAEVAVEGVVGELARLSSIRDITLVQDFRKEERSKTTALVHLAAHLDSLAPR